MHLFESYIYEAQNQWQKNHIFDEETKKAIGVRFRARNCKPNEYGDHPIIRATYEELKDDKIFYKLLKKKSDAAFLAWKFSIGQYARTKNPFYRGEFLTSDSWYKFDFSFMVDGKECALRISNHRADAGNWDKYGKEKWGLSLIVGEDQTLDNVNDTARMIYIYRSLDEILNDADMCQFLDEIQRCHLSKNYSFDGLTIKNKRARFKSGVPRKQQGFSKKHELAPWAMQHPTKPIVIDGVKYKTRPFVDPYNGDMYDIYWRYEHEQGNVKELFWIDRNGKKRNIPINEFMNMAYISRLYNNMNPNVSRKSLNEGKNDSWENEELQTTPDGIRPTLSSMVDDEMLFRIGVYSFYKEMNQGTAIVDQEKLTEFLLAINEVYDTDFQLPEGIEMQYKEDEDNIDVCILNLFDYIKKEDIDDCLKCEIINRGEYIMLEFEKQLPEISDGNTMTLVKKLSETVVSEQGDYTLIPLNDDMLMWEIPQYNPDYETTKVLIGLENSVILEASVNISNIDWVASMLGQCIYLKQPLFIPKCVWTDGIKQELSQEKQTEIMLRYLRGDEHIVFDNDYEHLSSEETKELPGDFDMIITESKTTPKTTDSNEYMEWKEEFNGYLHEMIYELQGDVLDELGLEIVVDEDYVFNGGKSRWLAAYERSSREIKNGKIVIAINYKTMFNEMKKRNIADDSFNIETQARITVGHEIGHGLVDFIKTSISDINPKTEKCLNTIMKCGARKEESIVEEFGEYQFYEATYQDESVLIDAIEELKNRP